MPLAHPSRRATIQPASGNGGVASRVFSLAVPFTIQPILQQLLPVAIDADATQTLFPFKEHLEGFLWLAPKEPHHEGTGGCATDRP